MNNKPFYVDEHNLPLRLMRTKVGTIAVPWSRSLLKKILGPTLRIYVTPTGCEIKVSGVVVGVGKTFQEAAARALGVLKSETP